MIKKTLSVSAVLLLTLLTPALAAAAEWTGWLTDEQCGAKGAKAEHADCAKKCAESGAKVVFYNTADQKLYTLDNQELALKHVGHEVKVTGEADGTSIKVASIDPVKADAHGHGH